MARGKHASASKHRRLLEADEHMRNLQRALKAERRAREQAERAAADAELLRERVRKLEADLALATSDEIAQLHDEIHRRDGRVRDVLAVIARYPSEERPVAFYDDLRRVCTGEEFAEFYARFDSPNREGRRGRRTSSPGHIQNVLDAAIVLDFEERGGPGDHRAAALLRKKIPRDLMEYMEQTHDERRTE